MSEEENKAYLRPKFNKEDNTKIEEKATENKQNERTSSKGFYFNFIFFLYFIFYYNNIK